MSNSPIFINRNIFEEYFSLKYSHNDHNDHKFTFEDLFTKLKNVLDKSSLMQDTMKLYQGGYYDYNDDRAVHSEIVRTNDKAKLYKYMLFDFDLICHKSNEFIDHIERIDPIGIHARQIICHNYDRYKNPPIIGFSGTKQETKDLMKYCELIDKCDHSIYTDKHIEWITCPMYLERYGNTTKVIQTKPLFNIKNI